MITAVALSVFLHTTINLSGILTNGLLLYLVVRKTPKTIRTYSVLIFSCGLCDFFTCLSELFVQPRMVPGGMGLFFFFHGPCRFFGPIVCFIGMSFVLHCYIFALYNLMLSFCYRFYVLVCDPPKIYTLITIALIFYIPCFIQFIAYSFTSDQEDATRKRVSEVFGYDISNECISGNINILRGPALFMALHQNVPIAPVYITILLLRRAIVKKLSSASNMSEKTRQLHAQLLKALTYQSCIPLFYSATVSAYSMGQLDIIHHPFLEYSSLLFAGLIPVLTPIGSVYFIQPYRYWFLRHVLRREKVNLVGIKTTTVATDRDVSKF